MPNIPTRIGRYCNFMVEYTKTNTWNVTFAMNTSSRIYFNERYYNYGFSKRIYCACNECREYLFGPFRLVDGGIMERAYESIIEVIKTETNKKGYYL